MSGLYELTSKLNQVKNMVLQVPPIEAKTRELTSNVPWGSQRQEMMEIADATHNYDDFKLIMKVVWERMNDKNSNRHVLKGLQLLEFLIFNGSERVLDEAKDFASQISDFKHYHFRDENGKEIGQGVRDLALKIAKFLRDDKEIEKLRSEAKRARSKYQGISKSDASYGSSYSSSRSRRYDDDDYESTQYNNGNRGRSGSTSNAKEGQGRGVGDDSEGDNGEKSRARTNSKCEPSLGGSADDVVDGGGSNSSSLPNNNYNNNSSRISNSSSTTNRVKAQAGGQQQQQQQMKPQKPEKNEEAQLFDELFGNSLSSNNNKNNLSVVGNGNNNNVDPFGTMMLSSSSSASNNHQQQHEDIFAMANNSSTEGGFGGNDFDADFDNFKSGAVDVKSSDGVIDYLGGGLVDLSLQEKPKQQQVGDPLRTNKGGDQGVKKAVLSSKPVMGIEDKKILFNASTGTPPPSIYPNAANNNNMFGGGMLSMNRPVNVTPPVINNNNNSHSLMNFSQPSSTSFQSNPYGSGRPILNNNIINNNNSNYNATTTMMYGNSNSTTSNSNANTNYRYNMK